MEPTSLSPPPPSPWEGGWHHSGSEILKSFLLGVHNAQRCIFDLELNNILSKLDNSSYEVYPQPPQGGLTSFRGQNFKIWPQRLWYGLKTIPWCKYGNHTTMGSWIPSRPDLVSIRGPDPFAGAKIYISNFCGCQAPMAPALTNPSVIKY